jgi:uncharacterized coiled-coil protein SlyX
LEGQEEQREALARVSDQLARIAERLDAMEEREKEKVQPQERRRFFGLLRGG